MAISIRSRFILISVSLTLLALLLFGSVMYDRAIQYKHGQEIKTYRVLNEQLHQLVSDLQDLSLIKQALADNISFKTQPALIFAVLDEQRNIVFNYSKHEPDENVLGKLYKNIKEKYSVFEDYANENNTSYFWFIDHLSGYSKHKYSLLIIYPLSSSVRTEVMEFFGLPFFISGFLLCWMMVWASIILSSLVAKLQKQKQILSDQAADIEKARDEAMNANFAKSNFLANMSHEIRTPLTSIIGFSESCLDIDQSMKERSNAIKTIINSGKHLLHIINEILDLSKIEAGKLEIETVPVSVVELLDEVNMLVSIMADGKDLLFEINYTYPIPENIFTDPLRLKQILINLCSNAVKFTDKGHVYLNVKYVEESSSLIFDVVDTGIGMTNEQLEKIFKPFEQADTSITRKFGGTGLGLALSRKYTEMLNGELSVESTVNNGSCFTVSFKIADTDLIHYIYNDISKHQVKKTNERITVIPKLKGRVLVVEDNKDIQLLIIFLLKKVGIEPDVVENGKLALKATLESDYDIVLMDVQMPVMDGLTAMHELKRRGYNKPVFTMTANVMKKDRDECKEAGFSGFISKPIDRNELYLLLSDNLSESNLNIDENILFTSSLLNDDPGLIDLIDKFIRRLPDMIIAIKQANEVSNVDELSNLIHQLKGVGGGYGYPELTDLCAKIEFQITSGDVENVNTLIKELSTMCDQIIEGSAENHKVADAARS